MHCCFVPPLLLRMPIGINNNNMSITKSPAMALFSMTARTKNKNLPQHSRSALKMMPKKESSKQNRQDTTIINGNNTKLQPPTKRMQPANSNNINNKLLIPFLVYILAQFLPPTLLNWGNDEFQLLKQQFSALAASIGPTTEYNEELSAMYNQTLLALFVLLLSK